MSAPLDAAAVVALLELRPLPGEGGWFRETWRGGPRLPADALGGRYTGPRDGGTAIYYLLGPGEVSLMHRLPGDELYHFYLGDPVELLTLGEGGAERVVLGQDIAAGMRVQHRVAGGRWQGSRLLAGGRFALMGTTMTPGFDFADWEAGARGALVEGWPEAAALIAALTPG